ncbi:hypothetical protein DXG01_014094 [Tephrocybe rancida]|nr:hypothetical protein DXG01_014094 [Tephrocybe rancida]
MTGVMTKPDMLTAGSTRAREMWLEIIEGREHPLVHGYYCTRQPDDAQRAENITPNEARAAEAAFFSETDPWSNSTYENRFGTVHLIASLSQLLVGIINDTLPRIMAEAASKLEDCNRALSILPKEIVEDPSNYMLKLLTGFCDDLSRSLESGLDVTQLVHLNRDSYAEFKVAIWKTAPNFVPTLQAASSLWSSLGGDYFQGQPFYLNDMREHIKRLAAVDNSAFLDPYVLWFRSITRELPNNVPFSAKVDLITKFQAGWEEIAEVCLRAVHKHVHQMLDHQIAHTFHRYGHLEGYIKILVADMVKSRFESCKAILGHVLKVEATPYTQNVYYLSSSTAKWLARYKEERSGKSTNGQTPHKRRTTDDEEEVTTPAPAAAPPLKCEHFAFSVCYDADGLLAIPFSFAKDATPEIETASAFGMPAAQGSDAPAQGIFGAPKQPSPQALSSTSSAFGLPRRVPTLAPIFGVPPSATAASPIQAVDDGREKKISSALAALAALGYRGVSEVDFGKLIPPDEYETEIQVMAEVRGYFQIAYKRVIDYIPSLIDLLFVKAIAQDMQGSLITKLSLGTADAPERCAVYLAENPTVVAKRKELTIRKERLDQVRQALQAFELVS